VASSGIAVTLLNGRRTARSAFKLPLILIRIGAPFCLILNGLIRVCHWFFKNVDLLIGANAPWVIKVNFKALYRMLKDIRRKDFLMGNITVYLSVDFRQQIPVVPRGTGAMKYTPV